MDKLRKKRKTAAGKRLCKCRDVNVYVVNNMLHVKTGRTCTPAQLQALVKSCQLSSSVFLVRTTISSTHVRTTSHIQKAQSQFPRKCSCTQPVKVFREKIGCVVLRVHSTHGSAESVLLQEDRSTSNVVASGFLNDFLCVFLHRLPYCDHLRLSSCSARWYASSSTLNARCPATGINESAEEDHPYTSPTRKLSASKSSLGRRRSVEVCPTHMLDHPYSFCRVVSRGDPQEVINLGLAALDSPLEIVSRVSSSTRNLFSLPLAWLSHS